MGPHVPRFIDPPPTHRCEATAVAAVLDEVERQNEVHRLRTDVKLLQNEVARLAGWLRKIEGGDSPCRDEVQLRQWAYEAVTLGHEVPGRQHD
jgi:hypothetical protein